MKALLQEGKIDSNSLLTFSSEDSENISLQNVSSMEFNAVQLATKDASMVVLLHDLLRGLVASFGIQVFDNYIKQESTK